MTFPARTPVDSFLLCAPQEYFHALAHFDPKCSFRSRAIIKWQQLWRKSSQSHPIPYNVVSCSREWLWTGNPILTFLTEHDNSQSKCWEWGEVREHVNHKYSLGRQLVPKVLQYVFWKFPFFAWEAWQLQYSQPACGTLRKYFTKPLEQVAFQDCIIWKEELQWQKREASVLPTRLIHGSRSTFRQHGLS